MSKRGTTLLEVMLTSTLLMVVVAAIVRLFQMSGASSHLSAEQQYELDAVLALDSIRSEVRQASSLTFPTVAQLNQASLRLSRVDPGQSSRLPTILPDPVGPGPIPSSWAPLRPIDLATVSYSLAGSPLRLQRTSRTAAGAIQQVPLLAEGLLGFAVDHPAAGQLVLRASFLRKRAQVTRQLQCTVECE